MTAAVLWKEYRQQRAVWLAIAIVGILLVTVLAVVMGNGTRLEEFQDRHIRGLLNAVVLCLVVTYGLVSGALLLAGELDEGTMVFLDCLTGQRATLWTRKCAAGALFTLLQSLVLGALGIGLGFMPGLTALELPLLGLNALAWGLLAGALCPTVLTAVLAGIGLMAISWLWSPFSWTIVDLTVVEGAAALGAGYASRRIFCRDDRARLPGRPRLKLNNISWPKLNKALSRLPADLQVLLWLINRQGRWVFRACFGVTLLLGLTVGLAPLLLWPTVTFLVGVTFGLAAFAPDQNQRHHFLGSQRFPTSKLWAVKVSVWGLRALGLTVLAWLLATALVPLLRVVWGSQSFRNVDVQKAANPAYWVGQWTMYWSFWPFLRSGDAVLLAGIWSLYGFCFGQFFGQLARRPVIAAIVAVFIAAPLACLWVPSLLVGGVQIWQVLIVPGLLLVTTSLTLRPWLAGRLWEPRLVLAIGSAAVLMVGTVVGCLWYRAVEVPDVGEPFDVKAFLASLPTPDQNEAGALIRHAALTLEERRQMVPLHDDLEPDRDLIMAEDLPPFSPKDVLKHGWPKRDKYGIGLWLDEVFGGEWVKEANKAAGLPLGMVEDPRLAAWNSLNSNSGPIYVSLAELFSARALQLQAKGDSRAALNDLDTALALARQVKNYATGRLLPVSQEMERAALTSFHWWLEKLGPDKELLQAALKMLQRHEAETPNPANSIKVSYVIHRNEVRPNVFGPTLAQALQGITFQAPWEKERQTRLMHALALSALQSSQQPGFNGQVWFKRFPDAWEAFAARAGLPPAEGPGSALSARHWGQLVDQARPTDFPAFHEPLMFATRSQQWLHAAQLVTAVALYQADHGKPPAKLEDIVPNYLASLPNDPLAAGPFQYRIAQHQEVVASPSAYQVVASPSPYSAYQVVASSSAYRDYVQVAIGQALVWSSADLEHYVVPRWKK